MVNVYYHNVTQGYYNQTLEEIVDVSEKGDDILFTERGNSIVHHLIKTTTSQDTYVCPLNLIEWKEI